jgi:hypothetical protein
VEASSGSARADRGWEIFAGSPVPPRAGGPVRAGAGRVRVGTVEIAGQKNFYGSSAFRVGTGGPRSWVLPWKTRRFRGGTEKREGGEGSRGGNWGRWSRRPGFQSPRSPQEIRTCESTGHARIINDACDGRAPTHCKPGRTEDFYPRNTRNTRKGRRDGIRSFSVYFVDEFPVFPELRGSHPPGFQSLRSPRGSRTPEGTGHARIINDACNGRVSTHCKPRRPTAGVGSIRTDTGPAAGLAARDLPS